MTQVNVTAGVPASFPDSRMRMHYAGGAQCTFVTLEDMNNPDANVVAIPSSPVQLLTSTPVAATAQYFGINTGEIGLTTPPNPMPGYPFGTVRSHDTDGITWRDINTSDEVYDWALMDLWVDTHYTAGRDIIYVVYQTPTWASARPADVGPYGSGGFNAEPASMTTLSTFVTTLINRYNGKIKYLEVSNEPNFEVGGVRFYSGTVEKLSEMTRVINQAAKAIDPTIKIISASVTNIDNSPPAAAPDVAATYFAAMMAASDGAAGIMSDWVDVIGVHLYGTEPNMVTRINAAKTMRTNAGLGALQIFDTETGVNAVATMSDYNLFVQLVRLLLIPLCLGISKQCYYALGKHNISGYSLANRPIVLNSLSILINDVINYGITSAGFLSDGRISFKINNINYIV